MSTQTKIVIKGLQDEEESYSFIYPHSEIPHSDKCIPFVTGRNMEAYY